MSLTEKDLKAIEHIVVTKIEDNNDKLIEEVKDIVDFAIEKSEMKFDKRFDKIGGDITDMKRDIGDIIDTQREFLNYFDNHEKRITKLEVKTGLKTV